MITFKAKTPSGEIIKSAFSTFLFPAGEAHTKREERRSLEPVEIAIFQPTAESLHTDLFQIGMWADAAMRESVSVKTVLIMPYFPGARADRGTPFGAQVYVDYIYSLMLNQVILYDPHSEVVVDLLAHDPGLKIAAVYPEEILGSGTAKIVMTETYTGVIAPDKGAVKRASAVARKFGIPVYTATKVRDFETGKLTGFGIENPEGFPKTGEFLVVDDICDGGGTFMGLAEAVKELSPEVELDLYVSHGVFSNKALELLPKAFRMIYTTDSYDPSRHLDHEKFRSIDVIRPLLKKVI